MSQFNGDIGIESIEGKGSTVNFDFLLEEENNRKMTKSRSTASKVAKMFKETSIWDQWRPLIKSNVLLEKEKNLSMYRPEPKLHRTRTKPIKEFNTNYPQILVVDDQIFNIEAIKVVLKVCKIDLDTQVTHAFNGQQAVDRVKERQAQNMFDLILMDCNMPFMDGPTAC